MADVAEIVVFQAAETEREWIRRRLSASWGSATVVSRGRAQDAARLPALIAQRDGERVGIATFELLDDACELVTLDAFPAGRGVGTVLLEEVAQRAQAGGCRRLWLVTTNDNLGAIRFYRRRGLRLVAVHRGAVDEARRLKPEIPSIGAHGIPLHDELEFERALGR